MIQTKAKTVTKLFSIKNVIIALAAISLLTVTTFIVSGTETQEFVFGSFAKTTNREKAKKPSDLDCGTKKVAVCYPSTGCNCTSPAKAAEYYGPETQLGPRCPDNSVKGSNYRYRPGHEEDCGGTKPDSDKSAPKPTTIVKATTTPTPKYNTCKYPTSTKNIPGSIPCSSSSTGATFYQCVSDLFEIKYDACILKGSRLPTCLYDAAPKVEGGTPCQLLGMEEVWQQCPNINYIISNGKCVRDVSCDNGIVPPGTANASTCYSGDTMLWHCNSGFRASGNTCVNDSAPTPTPTPSPSRTTTPTATPSQSICPPPGRECLDGPFAGSEFVCNIIENGMTKKRQFCCPVGTIMTDFNGVKGCLKPLLSSTTTTATPTATPTATRTTTPTTTPSTTPTAAAAPVAPTSLEILTPTQGEAVLVTMPFGGSFTGAAISAMIDNDSDYVVVGTETLTGKTGIASLNLPSQEDINAKKDAYNRCMWYGVLFFRKAACLAENQIPVVVYYPPETEDQRTCSEFQSTQAAVTVATQTGSQLENINDLDFLDVKCAIY